MGHVDQCEWDPEDFWHSCETCWRGVHSFFQRDRGLHIEFGFVCMSIHIPVARFSLMILSTTSYLWWAKWQCQRFWSAGSVDIEWYVCSANVLQPCITPILNSNIQTLDLSHRSIPPIQHHLWDSFPSPPFIQPFLIMFPNLGSDPYILLCFPFHISFMSIVLWPCVTPNSELQSKPWTHSIGPYLWSELTSKTLPMFPNCMTLPYYISKPRTQPLPLLYLPFHISFTSIASHYLTCYSLLSHK